MSDITVKESSFKRQLFLLAVAVMLVNTGFGIIFPIFPKLLEDVGQGDAFDLGVLAAAFGAAYLVGSPIFGNIADRVGKKRVILVGLIGFSVSNLIYVFATNINHLYLARIIEGFFAAAILPPAIALTAQLSPRENRGKYLGLLGASQMAGIIVGPLLGGVLFEGVEFEGFSYKNFDYNGFSFSGSIELPFYASAVIGVIAFVWSYFQLPSGIVESSAKQITESEVRDNSKHSFSSRISDTLRHQIRVLPKPLYMFFLFVLAEMLAILAWLTIEPGFVFYFYDDLLMSPTEFGIFVGAFGVASVLGQSLLGNLSDRVGRKPVMIVGQMFSFLFYFSLLQARTLEELIFAVVFAGIGSGLRDPAMKAWLSDLTKEENRATVFGIESGLMSSSQIIGPIVGGYLAVLMGMEFLFYVAISINLINILLLSSLRFDTQIEEQKVEITEFTPTTSIGK